MKSVILSFLILLSCSGISQEETLIQKTPNGDLEGTLLLPKNSGERVPLVLIIAGSGPTDRNGNNDQMENNSLKMIADSLAAHHIASFRFDKRGVAQSSDIKIDEEELRPETYVEDIKGWINILHANKKIGNIILAGHSEGSLLGMLASLNNPKVKGFVSIAGAGRPIDEILKEQFSGVTPEVKTIIYDMLDKLKRGDTIEHVPVVLYAVFRPSVQPYMHAWMQYNPAEIIKSLTIPVLITTGTTDIQVKVLDAELLAKAQPKAQLKIIKNMNHVLKDCDTLNKDMQMEVYSNPRLPLNAEFSLALTDFIQTNFILTKKTKVSVKK